MSAVEHLPVVTFDQYLAGEVDGGRRHEWVAGQVYLMAGGTERHDLVNEAVNARLRPGALREGCRSVSSNRLVRLGHAAYYPDILITCGRAAHVHYETDLVLAVEVLSPSTRTKDRREKAAAYASAPSFEQYLLVDAEDRLVRVATPTPDGLQWSLYGSGAVVHTRFGDLDVDEVYDEVEALATT